MACCLTQQTYGYEDSRFEKDFDENFHCSICYNVLKEPRTSRNNDLISCLACISQHLKVNSQTCPECNEPEPRGYHGAEIVEDKVLILRGYDSGETVDSVLEFDPTTKKCKEMPKLLLALSKGATVRWTGQPLLN